MPSAEETKKYNEDLAAYNKAVESNKKLDKSIASFNKDIEKLEEDIEKLETAKTELTTRRTDILKNIKTFSKEIDSTKFKGTNETAYDTNHKQNIIKKYKDFSNSILGNDSSICSQIDDEIKKLKKEIESKEHQIKIAKSYKTSPVPPVKP